MYKLTILLTIVALSVACGTSPDFPYPPATYRTPICFPDDWLKSLVDHNGSLNYDFGPGPYARPRTEIAIGLKGLQLSVTQQKLYNPHVPVVITDFKGNNVSMQQRAFALVEDWYPAVPKDPNAEFDVKRTLGFTGAIGWAKPTKDCDPAFANVASGTGRPIRYSIPVTVSEARRVALGFCDSYREKGKTKRVMTLNVEGAAERDIDLLVSGEQNQPQT